MSLNENNGIEPSESNDLLEKELVGRPSNERLLCTAFISFMSFAMVQTIAAFIAGSEAMMGDSAAMMVDALTYLFNWYAERQKLIYAEKLKGERGQTGNRLLQYRKYTYQLELIPPLLSVSSLLVVTAIVMNKAVRVLVLDAKRDVSEQADPNTHTMMLFSFLNLLLDFLNVFCFAKAKHAMGFKTKVDEEEENGSDSKYVTTMKSLLSDDELSRDDELENSSSSSNEAVESSPKEKKIKPMEIEDACINHQDHNPWCISSGHNHDEESNLNMCSAYTHVFADTLRSIAVIIASLLAEFIPSVTSEEADASAAVVVSVLIAFSLVPLFGGMVQTFGSLKRVNELLKEEELENGQYEGDEDYFA